MKTNHHLAFPKLGSLTAQLEFVLEYATSAPSTHNTQPWLFLISENKLKIFPDLSRKLMEGDRDGRNLCISLGACIEHAVIALKFFGMFDSLMLYDDVGEGKPVATVTVHESTGEEPQFRKLILAMEERFNARGPFISQNVPTDVLAEVNMLREDDVSLFLSVKSEDVAALAGFTAEGMRIVHGRRAFRTELSLWMTNNYSNRKDGIPGYAMLAPGLLSILLPQIIRRFNMGGVLAKLNTKSIISSSGICILHTHEDEVNSWLKTGMLFERASLYFNASGVRTSIYVASIEVPTIREKLQALFTPATIPQFTFVFGFPKFQLRKSPRLSPRERMFMI